MARMGKDYNLKKVGPTFSVVSLSLRKNRSKLNMVSSMDGKGLQFEESWANFFSCIVES